MPSIAPTIVSSSASGAPRYSGRQSRRNKRGRSSWRFHTTSEQAGRMSQPLHGEPNTWIAAESPSLDASCAESVRGRLITAASRYAGIGTVLMGLVPAFDLEAATVTDSRYAAHYRSLAFRVIEL